MTYWKIIISVCVFFKCVQVRVCVCVLGVRIARLLKILIPSVQLTTLREKTLKYIKDENQKN